MSDIKENFTDAINNAEDTLVDYGHKISEDVVTLKDKLVVATNKCTSYVEDNPLQSISVSLLLGFILGRVLKS